MKDVVKISVIVQLPWSKEDQEFNYAIDMIQAQEGLIPLPREREIDGFSFMEAQRQIVRRENLAKMVSSMITAAILTACESEDTINGYKKGGK
jgi:hypothetical protein